MQKHLECDLLPYTKTYLPNLEHHFSTLGLEGMNECCLNILGCTICDDDTSGIAEAEKLAEESDLVCLVPTGMVSLGSVAMAALYPVLTIIYGSLQGYAAGDMLVCAIGSGFMSGMVIYMHRANIQRIREGKEYRFGKHNKK